MSKKKVLITPLNWGLGHATRCIPVIKEFLKQNAEVFIASDGRSLDLLRKEFSSLTFFELKSYDIRYPENASMVWKMIFSFPKIISAIRKEYTAIEKIVTENKIDIIFSDNRYGCWSKKAYSVFMTHQLNIQAPDSLKWTEPFIFRMNKNFILKFNECWVPDFEGEENLSGKLSHQSKLKEVKFIGPLSRFNSFSEKKISSEKYDLMIICSGPEPQRTIFEAMMRKEIFKTNCKTIMVRGITETEKHVEQKNNLKIISHVDADEMQHLIESSSVIISRPGYSSIMDLVVLGKKAIFIPTPGQTEQEYLADYFMSSKKFFSVSQIKFNLQKALGESSHYAGLQIKYQPVLLTSAVESILSK